MEINVKTSWIWNSFINFSLSIFKTINRNSILALRIDDISDQNFQSKMAIKFNMRFLSHVANILHKENFPWSYVSGWELSKLIYKLCINIAKELCKLIHMHTLQWNNFCIFAKSAGSPDGINHFFNKSLR